MYTEFWLEFIELYKENQCLWNYKCDDFINYSKRKIAYGILLEKLWEIDDNADETTVKKEISSLKASFRREVAKVEQSKQNGSQYVPGWQYYESLRFLYPYENNIPVYNLTQSDTSAGAVKPQVTSREETLYQIDTPQQANENEGVNSPLACDGLEDDSSTFTAHLKLKMRAFNPLQKSIAQKLISDVMFLAETKQLQLTSSITYQQA